MSLPTLGFVVPVLDEAEGITSLLEYLSDHFPGVARIVVDGGSSDDTVAKAMRCSEQLLIAEPGRARQMNLGAAGIEADYLVFLHADTLPQFALTFMQQQLQSRPAWGFCPLQLSGDHWLLRWVERGINWRSGATGVATGDQMLFVRRDLFQTQGGFADQPLMEDVELCKRLRRVSPPHILGKTVLTSSRRWEQRGIVRTIVQMWCLRLAYRLGVSPRRLWRAYYG